MKDIGEFFKEKLENGQEKPPQGVWEKIAADSQVKQYNRKQRLQRGLLYTLPVVVVTTIAVVSILLLQNGNPLKQQETAQQIVKTEQIAPSSPKVISDTAIVEPQEEKREQVAKQVVTKQIPENADKTVNEEKIELEKIEPRKPIAAPPVLEKTIGIKEELKKEDQEKEKSPLYQTDRISDQEKKRTTDSVKEREDRDSNNSENNLENQNATIQDDAHSDKIPDLSIPDAFSPNGDGINDEFKAKTDQVILDYNMLIYDRWGKLVFQARDINIGWNGEYKGQLLQSGSYVYMVTYRNAEGEEKMQKGTILLVR